MSAELVLHIELDKFEDDTAKQIVRDASGKGHHGEMRGLVEIVADDTFGACAALDGHAGNYISVPFHNSLNIKGDVTIQAWLYESDEQHQEATVVGRGSYALKSLENGKSAFQRVSPDILGQVVIDSPKRALNTWYHLAGVITEGKENLYLHDLQGKLIGTGKVIHKPGDKLFHSKDDFLIGGGDTVGLSGKIAHVRVYRGARTQVEIERDIASDHLELVPFRKSHPIDFRLHDDDDQAVLYITDDPQGHNLNLELRNTSAQAIQLNGSEGKASEGNHHFAVRFNPGVLSVTTLNLLAKEPSKILKSRQHWDLGFPSKLPAADEAATLYLLDKGSKTTFDPDECRTVKLHGISAAPGSGARGTQVTLVPGQLSATGGDATPITGLRTQYLHITNQRGHKWIPLHVWLPDGNGILNDDKSHSLTIRISNASEVADIALNEASKFLVSFDVSDKDDNWALTDTSRANEVRLMHGKVELQKPGRGQGTNNWEWELQFAEARVLPRRGSHVSPLEINLKHLRVPPKSCGHANVYVRYENIPGYQDGQFILTVEKGPFVVAEGSVGIGRLPGPGVRVSINGGVHIASDEHEAAKKIQLHVEGLTKTGSFAIGDSATIRHIADSPAEATTRTFQILPSVKYVNDLLGSIHDVLFFSSVQLIAGHDDGHLQFEFDPKHKPGVSVTGNVAKYAGLLKFTTRHKAWRSKSGDEWDSIYGEMKEYYTAFVIRPRMRLSIFSMHSTGPLWLRTDPGKPEGINAQWELSSPGHLSIKVTEQEHQQIYRYDGHHRGIHGDFDDHFKESIYWIDLSEITYPL